MNHKVNSVQSLYDDAKDLYTRCVEGKADTLINGLSYAVTTLKNTWEGIDAGVQIQNVIDVHNGLVVLRNSLSALAKDASVVASRYREIQNANRANLETIVPVTVKEDIALIEPYNDTRDSINIRPEANNAKATLDRVTSMYEDFHNSVNEAYNKIMNNWQEGPGRENSAKAFSDFMASSNKYKETLQEVSQSIANALKNYAM